MFQRNPKYIIFLTLLSSLGLSSASTRLVLGEAILWKWGKSHFYMFFLLFVVIRGRSLSARLLGLGWWQNVVDSHKDNQQLCRDSELPWPGPHTTSQNTETRPGKGRGQPGTHSPSHPLPSSHIKSSSHKANIQNNFLAITKNIKEQKNIFL